MIKTKLESDILVMHAIQLVADHLNAHEKKGIKAEIPQPQERKKNASNTFGINA